jgi:exodeoxyribonuclease VII large subunit
MTQLKFDDLRQPPAGGPKSYTVSQLVQAASRALEARLGEVWVEGELSNLRQPGSGHLYFTLKDARAQLAVVIFRTAAARLKFTLEDGLKLRCRGRLGIYDAQGRFQLTADAAEPAGLGAQQLALAQLKRKLEAEGLFDPARKKPLPFLPRRVAVVTSPSGAALRDIVRVLHDRFPLQIVVCGAAVQGAEAPFEIREAIARADRLGVDLILLGRGGGSSEDLSAFNNEGVARAIAAARTPIVSAVGHETDVTIADLVADRRAPTPSVAAEMAVPLLAELEGQLALARGRLARSVRRQLEAAGLRLSGARARLGSPRTLIDRARMQLDELAGRLGGAETSSLARERRRLQAVRDRLAAEEPRARLARRRGELHDLEVRLAAAIRLRLGRAGHAHGREVARLDALSPLAVLARGYGLVYGPGGELLRDAGTVEVDDPLQVRLQRGRLRCRVTEVEDVGDGPDRGGGGLKRASDD